mgnify:FL=1
MNENKFMVVNEKNEYLVHFEFKDSRGFLFANPMVVFPSDKKRSIVFYGEKQVLQTIERLKKYYKLGDIKMVRGN